jgi:hypothetical protein
MRVISDGRTLTALSWAAAFLVSAFLEGETVVTVVRVGLFGTRPPLTVFQTVLHVLIALLALALWPLFRGRLERITLVIAAAASSSTALYGIGLRSAGLSAFRLLSHLCVYALITAVAGLNGAAIARTSVYRSTKQKKGPGFPEPTQGTS